MDPDLIAQMEDFRNNDLIPWLEARGYAPSGRALGKVTLSRDEQEITVPLWFDPVYERPTEDFEAQMAACLTEVGQLEAIEVPDLVAETRLDRSP